MYERKKLLKISPQAFVGITNHLANEYKDVLVFVVEQESSKKFTIYFVIESYRQYCRIPKLSLFKAFENVVDYKYDNSKATLLANIETSAQAGYWIAFSVESVTLNQPKQDFSFDAFAKIEYSGKAPEAFFRNDFSYLPTARVVNIASKNYLINYSSWNELHTVKPMYYDRFLDIGPSGTTLYSSFNELEALFGPFASIAPFEEGTYPYLATCFHGYWGKNKEGNIAGMFVTHDETFYDSKFIQKQTFRMNSKDYNYFVTFEEPLKSLQFFTRDWEQKDLVNKNHCARDIWKLTYPDGSKAVMFHSIGDHDSSYDKWFTYFILKEGETKEYFSD